MIKLTPNPDNPRQVTKEKVDRLIKKIKAFPEMLEKRPIVYDENKVILGGNTKYKSLEILEKEGFEIKDSYFSDASGWTEDQKKNFIINDNLHEGDWDYEILANGWDVEQLTDWGVDIKDWTDNGYGTDFNLPDGDKEPFQQMTFILADGQAEQIKNAITNIKKTEEYKYVETMGNENSNGNALYLIITQWEKQKI